MLDRGGDHRLASAIREVERSRRVGLGQDERELLAAVAREKISGSSRTGAQHVCDLLQAAVAADVAVICGPMYANRIVAQSIFHGIALVDSSSVL